MPFEPTVDSLDAVPEDARPFYRQDAGTKKFNLITASSIDKLEGTLTRTKAEREEARTAAAEAAKWKDLGLTPEEIATLKQEKADRERTEAERKGEFTKLEQQIKDNHAKELEKVNGTASRYKTALEKQLIDATATTAIAELKGTPALLLPHIRDRVKVEEGDDGQFKVTVLDTDGKTPKLNDKSEPMTIKELVASMREDEIYGKAFEGSGHSGAGGTGGTGGTGPSTAGLKKSAMSIKQKTAFMQEHGHEAYAKLPW